MKLVMYGWPSREYSRVAMQENSQILRKRISRAIIASALDIRVSANWHAARSAESAAFSASISSGSSSKGVVTP